MKNNIKLLLISLLFLLPTFGFAGQVVVLPERMAGKKVVTVNSSEYNKLLQSNDSLKKQLEQEAANWKGYSEKVDKQIQENYKIQNDLILEIQKLKEDKLFISKNLIEKDLVILKRNLIIGGLLLLITGYLIAKFYFRLPI